MSIRAKVVQAWQRLTKRERQIIRMRAGLDNNSEGMTLEEIGEMHGLTKQRVGQIVAQALAERAAARKGST